MYTYTFVYVHFTHHGNFKLNFDIIHAYIASVTAEQQQSGSFRHIYSLDMTIPGQSCPDNLTLHTSNSLRLCGKKTARSCDSLIIPVSGQSYQQVRGKVKAYQFGTTDGFLRWSGQPIGGSDDIESEYVDGISITHGQSPRNHVWTYAIGWRQHSVEHLPTYRDNGSCPSAGYGQPQPDFVGDNYFCSSGNPGPGQSFSLFSSTPLWSNILGNCMNCENDDLFFCVNLPATTTDDLEIRVCADETLGNEDIRIESMDFYIR